MHHPWRVLTPHLPPGGCTGHVPPTVGTGCPYPCCLPALLCQAEPCRNTSRQRLAQPQLKALPSEYFMGSHGPGARALLRAFVRIYRKKQAEGEFLAWGRPPTPPGPAHSCGGLAACPAARKTGVRPREPGGMGARLQLVEGLTGLAVQGTPWHPPTPPTTPPPRDIPPGIGMGMVSCIPMTVPVQWGQEAHGAS